MYIESEFALLEANNEQLTRGNKKLVAALVRMVLAFDVGDMAHTTLNGRGYSALEDARQALAPYEDCTCLPDLPDGRGRGHCPMCEADSSKEILIGGE